MAKDGIEVRKIPGTHAGMLTEPSVRILAQQLKAAISLALTQDSGTKTASGGE
ncbi:hypothetical protein XM38_041100 [Halomicronema hongdechloris C2206]|uniref:Uncharacterized protein n=1 Tax=Halomicronema hongdechloris C2206 TaxID=1641165 RepID=A0A1Z3HS79_9CYAN|nr:hypothetical protein [Halomicronema hongdechloris]ASC73148.1 hypothetical protein XM38_041100 [Halomicronema hongdechloris C2206]